MALRSSRARSNPAPLLSHLSVQSLSTRRAAASTQLINGIPCTAAGGRKLARFAVDCKSDSPERTHGRRERSGDHREQQMRRVPRSGSDR